MLTSKFCSYYFAHFYCNIENIFCDYMWFLELRRTSKDIDFV